jgi:hypothetical protein
MATNTRANFFIAIVSIESNALPGLNVQLYDSADFSVLKRKTALATFIERTNTLECFSHKIKAYKKKLKIT